MGRGDVDPQQNHRALISLAGTHVRLRALEPADVELLYLWENDPSVWRVSGTTAPFSRHMLERFIEEQRYDLFETRQQRLVIERLTDAQAIGTLDLFDFDPFNRRAGIGILIYASADRRHGYASEALALTCNYVRQSVGMHQIWCNIIPDNAPSLALFRSAGFTEAGLKRDWNFSPDGFSDELMMQKIL